MVERASSILGPDGRPIVIKTLSQEVATPTVAGVRRTHEERVASGLTPERLGTILRDAAEGNARSYLTLAEEMEERYLHYASQLQTRRLAIEGIDVTIEAGKALVTANKAMIAHHGLELASKAEEKKVALKFEAAVAGGIPVIKGLREGAAANEIERVYGILNGTCNYILSTMEDTGRDFGDVLAEAQAKGFAEADPAFDVEGTDAAHKLSILAAISFGSKIDFGAVDTAGITRLRAADIAQASALGYVIRLIGMAETEGSNGSTALFQRVQPHLVPVDHPLAHVDGATNAVVAEGNFSGRLLFQGAGAGDGPTASAVVADLIDIARGEVSHPFSMPVSELEALGPAETGHRLGRAYVRFMVADRPGVLAEITAALRDAGVSIESLIQKGRAGDAVMVAMVTHEGPESAVRKALELLEGSDSLTEPPLVLQILGD